MNLSIQASLDKPDVMDPENQIPLFSQLETQIPSSMDPIPGTIEQLPRNQHLLEDLINENRKLREINNKIYEHFTEEFVGLKRSIDQVLTSLKRQRTLISKLPNLPCTEVSEIFDLEKHLDDEDAKQELLTKFNKQPTDDLKKYIFANLKSIIISDSLALKFPWTNVNNNIPVKDLKFIKLLKDSCLENIPQTNISKIEDIMKKYFNGAKDRVAKKNKRINKATTNTQK